MSMSADSILFDLWSATYDQPGLQNTTYRPIHDVIVARVSGLDPSVVLDLGCGTGQLTRRLAESFPSATVVGADLSAGMLKRAAEAETEAGQPIEANYVRADAAHVPLPDRSVDVVTCCESFHWYEDQPATLRGLYRVLRPGGRLLIASIATLSGAANDALERATSIAGRPVKAVPKRRMRQMMHDAGFDVSHQGRILRLGLVPWPVLTDATKR